MRLCLIVTLFFVAPLLAIPHKRENNNDDAEEYYYYDEDEAYDYGYDEDDQEDVKKRRSSDDNANEDEEDYYYYDDDGEYDYGYDDDYYEEGQGEEKKRRSSKKECCGIDKKTIDTSQHSACKKPSSDYSKDIPIDRDLILTLHNLCRQDVYPFAANMPELKWDNTLACVAKKWAMQCPDDHEPSYDHRKYLGPRQIFKLGIGQNLGLGWGDVHFGEIIKGWCDEQIDWQYGIGAIDKNSSKPIGHFTQMVWDRTTHVGCGAVQCKHEEKKVFVCNYGPAGNVRINGVDPKKQPYTKA